MMMPSLTSSSSSSSSSATVRVEKATSEFLNGPDWTLNMEICDTINSNQLLAKDVVKAVKKRVQHKNPQIQILALTLLEAMVKNCGDFVHFQIAERNILQEMTKTVKKKNDMHVRNKILTLIDSWQEAFGGASGKYPQYYAAYDELRRYGIQFPEIKFDNAPIFTPPVTQPPPRPPQPQPSYGMPTNSSLRLDEAMAADIGNLSLSGVHTMREVANLLSDMLEAVNPNDRSAVKDEVIVDLVERCRANQKKLIEMLASTGDEELLGQGLELNDNLQSLLAKHDAIASGSPLPSSVIPEHLLESSYESYDISPSQIVQPEPVRKQNPPSPKPSAPVLAPVLAPPPVVAPPQNRGGGGGGQVFDEDEDDEEDDFAQLARRHTKTRSTSSQSTTTSVGESSSSNALVLSEPIEPVKSTKEQDMVELLSLALTTTDISSSSSSATQTSIPSNQVPVSPSQINNNPYDTNPYLGNQSHVFNSYVAPWAQPQHQPLPQSQFGPHHQFQPQHHQFPPPHHQFQPQPEHQNQQFVHPSSAQAQAQAQAQVRAQAQQQYVQQQQGSGGYIPPPWAGTPGYYGNTGSSVYRPYGQGNQTSSVNNGGVDASQFNLGAKNSSSPTNVNGPKPFVPSYRLFEDLDVLGNAEAKMKVANNPSPSLSEARNQRK